MAGLAGCAEFQSTVTKLETGLQAVASNPTDLSLIAQTEAAAKQIAAAPSSVSSDFATAAKLVQAYIGSGTIPANIVAESTQVSQIGTALSKVLSVFPATQSFANTLWQISGDLAPASPSPSPTTTGTL
jgi:hypothetical protein